MIKLIDYSCPHCGAQLKVDSAVSTYICPRCRTEFYINKSNMLNSDAKYTEEQDKERYALLGLTYAPNTFGGVIRFGGLTEATFKQLLDKGYIEGSDRQNHSPTAKDFYDFIVVTDGRFTAHGYLVINSRDDRRISIEGVSYHGPISSTAKTAFDNWFKELKENDEYVEDPDEYEVDSDSVWTWWD